jgi:hypothetical protein
MASSNRGSNSGRTTTTTNPTEGRSCPCKLLPLLLSSFTGAEYGNVESLRRVPGLATKVDSAGHTPLHLAAQHGHVAATLALLQAGCPVNGHPTGGATPLHRASFSGAVATMRLLLQQPDCDLLRVDTSFGDGRTALHKAAAGGRYLAVHLLLGAAAARTPTTLWGTALAARDARGQTPLQVATAAAQQEQPTSVARWDVVAGGRAADWTVCVHLLRAAARDGSLSWSMDDGDIDDKLRDARIAAVASAAAARDCGDCGDDGNCVTRSWETAFQQGLLRSMNLNLSSVAKRAPRDVASLEINENDEAPDAIDIPLNQETKQVKESNDGISTAPEMDTSTLGRPCDQCSKRSIYLYPDSGSLLCQSCHDDR